MFINDIKMSIKYNITDVNMVYVKYNADFDITNNICEICKKSLYISPTQSKDTHGHTAVVGKCHHAFHSYCFANMQCCPIDNTVWIRAHIVQL